MSNNLNKINQEISSLNKELEKVMNSLDEIRTKYNKNRVLKEDALLFIEKTERIIELAESGRLSITEDQKQKISKTLLNILTIYKK